MCEFHCREVAVAGGLRDKTSEWSEFQIHQLLGFQVYSVSKDSSELMSCLDSETHILGHSLITNRCVCQVTKVRGTSTPTHRRSCSYDINAAAEFLRHGKVGQHHQHEDVSFSNISNPSSRLVSLCRRHPDPQAPCVTTPYGNRHRCSSIVAGAKRGQPTAMRRGHVFGPTSCGPLRSITGRTLD